MGLLLHWSYTLTLHVRVTILIVLLQWAFCAITRLKFMGGLGAVWITNKVTWFIFYPQGIQVGNECLTIMPFIATYSYHCFIMLSYLTLAALYKQCEAGNLICSWWSTCDPINLWRRTPYFSAIEFSTDIPSCQFGGKATRGTSGNHFYNHIGFISCRITVM